MAQIDLHNFFKYFDENNPKHVAAVEQFEKDLVGSPLMEDEANWVRIYRSQPEKLKSNILDVPWFPQTDNYRDANRTCNSSACAMCLEYFKPGTLQGAKATTLMLEKFSKSVTQQITSFRLGFLHPMVSSQAFPIVLLSLILIVSLPLEDLLLLVFFIAALYLVPQADTW